MDKKHSINLFYFFLIGSTIFVSSILHPILDTHFSHPILFYLISFFQSLLETSSIFLIGAIFEKGIPRFIYLLYYGLMFYLPIFHIANFFILRILDANLTYAIKFVFSQNSLTELWIALRATGVNLWHLSLIIPFILSIPVLGILFFKFTERHFSKHVHINFLPYTIVLSIVLLIPLDKFAISKLNYDQWTIFEKRLPFCRTILTYPHKGSLSITFHKPREASSIQTALNQFSPSLEKKPNIYLFIIESFRKDYLDETTAPHLNAFNKMHPSPSESFSNANASHMSWFSILHSNYPYYWNHENPSLAQGSIPLHLLKKMGYKIHLISSAELTYYQNDLRLFGHDHYLLDSSDNYFDKEAYVRDEKTIHKLMEINQEKEGHCYIVFLDSPHSEYSFPEQSVLFQPVTSSINYLGLGLGLSDLTCIQNRYKNSIHYVDSLLGNFFANLKKKNFYDDSIILITGDHGEEFYENNSLFHASHLNSFQTSVPIYYKLGQEKISHLDYLSCHMNIFPTILHYLTGQENFSSFLDGKSLLGVEKPTSILIANQNSSEAPNKFLIRNKNIQIIFIQEDSKKFFTILNVKDFNNSSLTIKNLKDFSANYFDASHSSLFVSSDLRASESKPSL
jgi:glucan phosphoethanolaminetransferase (alkaline phosphatase superfamily)